MSLVPHSTSHISHLLVVFRLHDDENGVNDDAHAAEACRAEPEDPGPDFAFVEAVQSKIP